MHATLSFSGYFPVRQLHVRDLNSACGPGGLVRRPAPALRRRHTRQTEPASRRCRAVRAIAERPARSPTTNQGSAAFDWNEQWYPVALEQDLSPTKPTAVAILGRRLVVWKSGGGEWSVFNDACPHRLAALSEGRVDPATGNLQCGYHGWEFDPSGRCTVVPQAPDARAAASPAACATSLPVRRAAGIIFVWLGTRAPAPGHEPPVLAGARARHIVSTFSRDLPFSSTTLLENVLDPAHIHFAHHRQLGHRKLASPIAIRMIPIVGSHSIAFAGDYYDGRVLCEFEPPCLVRITTAAGTSFAYYAIPVDAHRSRTIGVLAQAKKPSLRLRLTPRWFDHMRRNTLVDGDLPLMYSQEREITAFLTSSRLRQPPLYLPTSSDRLIVELRKWLVANSLPSGMKPYRIDFRERRDLLDRLGSHTELCTSTCAPAYKNVKILKKIAFSVAVLCGALAAVCSVGTTALQAQLVRGPCHRAMHTFSSPLICVLLVVAGLAAIVAHSAFRKLERRFVYVEDARKSTHAH